MTDPTRDEARSTRESEAIGNKKTARKRTVSYNDLASYRGYFTYNRNFIRHLSPGATAWNPAAAGSAALGALVVHDCGSGQQ